LFTHAIPPRHPPPVLKAWNEGDPLPDRYAIISSKNNYRLQQHKVLEGDRIMTDLLKHPDKREGVAAMRAYDIDDEVLFNNVLMVGSRKHTLVGRPLIPGAYVLAKVEEVTQLRKIIVSRKRKRMHFQKKQGHRHWVTVLKILKINCNFSAYMDPEFVEKTIRKEQEEREFEGVWSFAHGDDLKIIDLPENEGDDEISAEDLDGVFFKDQDGVGGEVEPMVIREGFFEEEMVRGHDAVKAASKDEAQWELESRLYDIESESEPESDEDDEPHEGELDDQDLGLEDLDESTGAVFLEKVDIEPAVPTGRRGEGKLRATRVPLQKKGDKRPQRRVKRKKSSPRKPAMR